MIVICELFSANADQPIRQTHLQLRSHIIQYRGAEYGEMP